MCKLSAKSYAKLRQCKRTVSWSISGKDKKKFCDIDPRLKAALVDSKEQLDVVKRENKNLADEIRDNTSSSFRLTNGPNKIVRFVTQAGKDCQEQTL